MLTPMPPQRSQPAPLAALQSHYEGYLTEAQRLQSAYADRIAIIIGFEGEFIRPSFAQHVLSLRDASPRVIDYVIGSVHHVHGLPIDYDAAMYADAARQAISLRSSSIDTTSAQAQEWLQCDYYDLQHDMLRALEPRVVGHFDLIRLLAADPAADPRASPAVWERVMRNLNLVKAQGGWLECNTAALRKGLAEPYPCRAIAEVPYPPSPVSTPLLYWTAD